VRHRVRGNVCRRACNRLRGHKKKKGFTKMFWTTIKPRKDWGGMNGNAGRDAFQPKKKKKNKKKKETGKDRGGGRESTLKAN